MFLPELSISDSKVSNHLVYTKYFMNWKYTDLTLISDFQAPYIFDGGVLIGQKQKKANTEVFFPSTYLHPSQQWMHSCLNWGLNPSNNQRQNLLFHTQSRLMTHENSFKYQGKNQEWKHSSQMDRGSIKKWGRYLDDDYSTVVLTLSEQNPNQMASCGFCGLWSTRHYLRPHWDYWSTYVIQIPNTKYQNGNLINKFLLNHKENKDN